MHTHTYIANTHAQTSNNNNKKKKKIYNTHIVMNHESETQNQT